ncbi:hypothetical protein AM593_00928, partial [Mytilus galloprovincialis]
MQPADLIRDGQGTIWLTEVKCSGSEITLLKCIYTTDTLSCSHYHDVGIHCFLNCSKEDEGVTPNEDVTHPTVNVVVVVILGVVVVIIGAVATLLVCWFRRRSSPFRTARSTTEPEHRSTPGPERSFDEPNNRSPPRNRRPLGEADNRDTIVSRSSNDHYDKINNMELSLSCSNSDYLEPSQGESSSNTEQQHDYCELRNTSGNSNVLESSVTINPSPAMPATRLTMRSKNTIHHHGDHHHMIRNLKSNTWILDHATRVLASNGMNLNRVLIKIDFKSDVVSLSNGRRIYESVYLMIVLNALKESKNQKKHLLVILHMLSISNECQGSIFAYTFKISKLVSFCIQRQK